MGNQPDYSLEVAHEIDEEVRALIEAAHTEAWEILNTYRDVLDDLVFELLEKETLTRTDLERIFDRGREAAADHRVQRLRRAHAVGQAADPDAGRAGPRARRAVAAAVEPTASRPRSAPTPAAATASRSPARPNGGPVPTPGPPGGGYPGQPPYPPPRLPDRLRAGRRAARARSARRRRGTAAAAAARRAAAGQPSSVPHNYGAPPDWRPATTPSGQSWPPQRPGPLAARHPAPVPPTAAGLAAAAGDGRSGPAAGSNGNGEHADPDARARGQGRPGRGRVALSVTADGRRAGGGAASTNGRRGDRPGRGPRRRCGSC